MPTQHGGVCKTKANLVQDLVSKGLSCKLFKYLFNNLSNTLSFFSLLRLMLEIFYFKSLINTRQIISYLALNFEFTERSIFRTTQYGR